jgi:O-succinylbenzoate synthase
MLPPATRMPYRFQFRRYRLPFRQTVRTGHGIWSEREGVLVRLEDASEGGTGAVGWGEAAPIPWFGTETVDEVEAACHTLGEWIEAEAMTAVPTALGCLRFALATAQREVDASFAVRETGGSAAKPGLPYLSVAALLPAGRGALDQILAKGEIGFRVFKWKVGVGDIDEELGLFDDVCGSLPSGAKLRLDANGAWDRRRAERWLDRCADRPVEFVEQPGHAPAGPSAVRSAREVGKEMDLLLGLASDFPTPIALDESLVGMGDVERWLAAGWPGVFVVKPLLLGDANEALARLLKAKAPVVFSSALETAVGARAALQLAFAWQGEARALGFGVWPLFADGRFDGPVAAPFIRAGDLAHLDPEAAWNALS